MFDWPSVDQLYMACRRIEDALSNTEHPLKSIPEI